MNWKDRERQPTRLKIPEKFSNPSGPALANRRPCSNCASESNLPFPPFPSPLKPAKGSGGVLHCMLTKRIWLQHFSIFRFRELMQSCGVRRPSVSLSVRPSVCKLCANRFFYHRNGWIATELAHDGRQTGLHPGYAQGQGQRSRDTGTSVMSRNVCYTVRSHVLSLHALTLWSTITLSFQYKYQAARCLNIGLSYSVIDAFDDLVYPCIR